MAKKKHEDNCPCGSGLSYENCCGIYINGQQAAPTAEALMRSRYTAYTLGAEEYLLQSWHSSTRPVSLNLKQDSHIKWIRLKVEHTERGSEKDDQGLVEFTAVYKNNGKAEKLHEASRFVREHGKWVYLDAGP